ncbi:TPA: type II secretion protein F, partial [Escherichia coli]|nr:type II secretion protein F [Escherichia coli]
RGDIAEAMFQVVKTAKGRQEMISSLVSVCLYPLILLTLCVVNMYNVHTRVIPMISAFAPEERWSVQMVILAKSSELVIGYGLWLLAGLLLLAILIRMSFSLYKGPRRRYLDRIPPWSLYQTFHGVN